MNVYVVLGYGVPKDIMTDGNYVRYLGAVFNRVWDENFPRPGEKWPVIVFSGGPTDMEKPYSRTEAGEMSRYFRPMMDRVATFGHEPCVVLLEEGPLSALDGLLAADCDMKSSFPGDIPEVTVFCEWTRRDYIATIANRLFCNGSWWNQPRVCGIDFDQSANRYRDPRFLAQRNVSALQFDLWALKSPENLQAHHVLHVQRLAYLRAEQEKGTPHPDAIHQWWQENLDMLMKS